MHVDRIGQSSKNTGFGGFSASKFSKYVKQLLPKHSRIQALDILNKGKGEKQNIIITAIGTGLVAPIFIKWNPLSKTDQDTRTYSAWRQPVSAVLAVLTQVATVFGMDKLMNNAINTGKFGRKYNRSLFPDEKFLQKTLKISEDEAKRITETLRKNLSNNLRSKDAIEYIEKGKLRTIPPGELRDLIKETLDEAIEFEKKWYSQYTGIDEKYIIKKMQAEQKYNKIMGCPMMDIPTEEIENIIKEKARIKIDELKAQFHDSPDEFHKVTSSPYINPHNKYSMRRARAMEFRKNSDFYETQLTEVKTKLNDCKTLKEFQKLMETKIKNVAHTETRPEISKIFKEIFENSKFNEKINFIDANQVISQ
jgi:hypothetical protein